MPDKGTGRKSDETEESLFKQEAALSQLEQILFAILAHDPFVVLMIPNGEFFCIFKTITFLQ